MNFNPLAASSAWYHRVSMQYVVAAIICHTTPPSLPSHLKLSLRIPLQRLQNRLLQTLRFGSTRPPPLNFPVLPN